MAGPNMFNSIKKLDGEPWSLWKKMIDSKGQGNKINETSHFMALNRTDMPVYGLCPKTEIFELVICNFCGLKYKLAAFAEHINLRHSNDQLISNQDVPIINKKGKLKRNREKFNLVTITVESNMQLDFMDIVSDRQALTIDSETVAKIKQLRVNRKTNISSENDVSSKEKNGLSSNGGFNVNEVPLNNELLSKKLNDSIIIKTYDASSTLAQDGEMVNMQPIVKLSPIPSNPLMKDGDMTDIGPPKKIALDSETTKSSDFNPDLHCGVIVNETDRCFENLDCKLHSVSLKKLVIGRSKLFDTLLTNYILDRNNTNEKLRVQPAEGPSREAGKLVTSFNFLDSKTAVVMPNDRRYDEAPKAVVHKDCTDIKKKKKAFMTEENVISSRTIRNSVNELHGLSLPVSIKNPSILCQLQNLKSKYYIPVKPARCSSIRDLLNINFRHKHVKEQVNSRAFKENTQSVMLGLEGIDKSPSIASSELKPEWFQQWHPGYRRAGGLLYANNRIKCVRKRSYISSFSSFTYEDHCDLFHPHRINLFRDKNELVLEEKSERNFQ